MQWTQTYLRKKAAKILKIKKRGWGLKFLSFCEFFWSDVVKIKGGKTQSRTSIKMSLFLTESYVKNIKVHLKSISSTSKINVALEGIIGGKPCCPYAKSGGHVNLISYPLLIWLAASSQPRITWPAPNTNSKASSLSLLLSNLVPSVNFPV